MPAARRILLLGPQRERPTVAAAVETLGIEGPVAIVTAGWEERESEDTELREHLGRPVVSLGLWPRAEDLFHADGEVRAVLYERYDRLRELQELYRLRLAPLLESCRTLMRRTDPARPDALHEPEIDDALDAVRRLDAHHLERTAQLDDEIFGRIDAARRPSLTRDRAELAEILEHCGAVLLAGGHVGILLNRLRLFGVLELSGEKPIVAWSGGAMALSERVVLFHDNPPQGPGDPEVYARGMGLVHGVVPLPHARHRLRLDDPGRVALFARRFAPDVCTPLDGGEQLEGSSDSKRWTFGAEARRLVRDGQVLAGGGPVSSAAVVVQELVEGARGSPGELERVLGSRTFPAVGDGWALFAYQGPADQVKLHHWIFGLPSARPFERVESTDLWTLELELQHTARVEYKLEVVHGDQRRLIRDPLNPHLAHDPFGANSVAQGPGYAEPDWISEQPGARRGEVVERRLQSVVFGDLRPISIYLPARFRDTRRYPLLVVHDGFDYERFASLAVVLDNLIHRLEIPPVVVALTQSPDRMNEYAASDLHTKFLHDELLPLMQHEFPLLDDPSDRALVGASFGAVAAMYAAWKRPGHFGKLLLQSGSFAFTDIGDHDRGPLFDPVVDFVNAFRRAPGVPAERIFMSCGIYESLIYYNRSLLPVLQKTGAEVRLVEAQDGHNWENWRDRLREGLSWLFPGPLWMVYE